MTELTHFGPDGGSRMVDVGHKETTARYARSTAVVTMREETLAKVMAGDAAKGDVLGVARLAGIMAAKRTGDWIPLCHPLSLDGIELSFEYVNERQLRIISEVRVTAKTGVEMESLVAVSAAALTVYDMCKAIDRGMVIESIQLEEKSGGQSGRFQRK